MKHPLSFLIFVSIITNLFLIAKIYMYLDAEGGMALLLVVFIPYILGVSLIITILGLISAYLISKKLSNLNEASDFNFSFNVMNYFFIFLILLTLAAIDPLALVTFWFLELIIFGIGIIYSLAFATFNLCYAPTRRYILRYCMFTISWIFIWFYLLRNFQESHLHIIFLVLPLLFHGMYCIRASYLKH